MPTFTVTRFRPFFLLVLALAAAVSPVFAQAPLPDVDLALDEAVAGDRVQPGIWRLAGTDPELPDGDLEPLRKIVGKASIVALGESFHTSGGLYEVKHRLFRFLVERLGFRALAFENNWTWTDRAARFVATCEGSADEAVRHFLNVWQSTETRDLLQWMCDWNRAHPGDPVHLFGFDVQQPRDDGAGIAAFLARVGVFASDPRVRALDRCEGVTTAPTRFGFDLPEADYRACLQAIDALEQHLARNRQAFQAQTSAADVRLAELHLLGLRSWEEQLYLYQRDGDRSFEAREPGMAEAFRTLRELRYPNVKTVVWAANIHVAKDAPAGGYGVLTMGTILGQWFKNSYRPIGLFGWEVEIDYPGFGCGAPWLPAPGSLEHRLHRLDQGDLLVDLAFPGGRPPFLKPRARYMVHNEDRIVPRKHYDALVFLDHSPKMNPLVWPSCR